MPRLGTEQRLLKREVELVLQLEQIGPRVGCSAEELRERDKVAVKLAAVRKTLFVLRQFELRFAQGGRAR